MEEIMQKIIDSVRWWLNKVIAAFKADWYIWGCLVAVAPFFGVPVLFVFGFWFFFLRNAPPPNRSTPPKRLQAPRQGQRPTTKS